MRAVLGAGESEERSRDVNATAVGDREQDGVGAATVITIGRLLLRTDLAGFAQDGW